MNILDIILLLCFIPAIINGLRKGFISQVIAIISLVLGTWLSFKFSVTLSHWMSQWIETSPQLLNTIAFAVIFVVVVFVLFAIGKIFEATIKIIMLSWLNKLLGILFAFLKCAIILGLVIQRPEYDLRSRAGKDACRLSPLLPSEKYGILRIPLSQRADYGNITP